MSTTLKPGFWTIIEYYWTSLLNKTIWSEVATNLLNLWLQPPLHGFRCNRLIKLKMEGFDPNRL